MIHYGCLLNSALCLALAASSAALAQGALAKAPPEACAGKLDAIGSGASQDVEADVQWLGKYCDAATKAQAVDMIANATAENAMSDTVAVHQAAIAQARGEITGVNAAASEANAEIIAGSITAVPVPPPTVVIVAPPPRYFIQPPPRMAPPIHSTRLGSLALPPLISQPNVAPAALAPTPRRTTTTVTTASRPAFAQAIKPARPATSVAVAPPSARALAPVQYHPSYSSSSTWVSAGDGSMNYQVTVQNTGDENLQCFVRVTALRWNVGSGVAATQIQFQFSDTATVVPFVNGSDSYSWTALVPGSPGYSVSCHPLPR